VIFVLQIYHLATLAENYPADFSNQKNEILDGEATPSSMQYKFKLATQKGK
jgi:hypothetical protein